MRAYLTTPFILLTAMLSACESQPTDEVTQAYDKQADGLEDRADNLDARAERLEDQADDLHAKADELNDQADQIRETGQNMSQQVRDGTIQKSQAMPKAVTSAPAASTSD